MALKGYVLNKKTIKNNFMQQEILTLDIELCGNYFTVYT